MVYYWWCTTSNCATRNAKIYFHKFLVADKTAEIALARYSKLELVCEGIILRIFTIAKSTIAENLNRYMVINLVA